MEQIDKRTVYVSRLAIRKRECGRGIPFDIVRAGLHWSLKMSRQMLPLELMLGWYMRVVKLTLGALKG